MFTRSLPRAWLAWLLISLLAIAPYLHGHMGASSESGLHINGLHALHLPDASSPQATALASTDEESLAVSVSASLPHGDADPAAWLACVFTLVMRLQPRAGPILPRPGLHGHSHTLYALGWPPPCLAPPRV